MIELTLLGRLVTGISRWSARLGGLMLFACAVVITADVVVRNAPGDVLGSVSLGSFELTRFGFAAAVAFGFAFALTQRAHIRIDLVYARVPLLARAVLDFAALLSLAAMGTVMAWYGWQVVAESARLGAMPNSTLRLPLVVPQTLWAAGLTWFAAVAGLLTADALVRLARGDVKGVTATAGIVAANAATAPR